MTRSGCLLCGGYGNRHDPIAHDAEPTEDERMTHGGDELRRCPECGAVCDMRVQACECGPSCPLPPVVR